MNVKALALRTGLKIKKYSPEILMVTGVITFIGTIVVACKQTTKAGEILDDHKRQMDEIKDVIDLSDKGELIDDDGDDIEYSPEQIKKDKMNVWAHTGVKFTKLYLPAAGLAALSLASFLASNKILKGRYIATLAAFNAVSDAFEKYRKRVRDEGGAELDRHYMYGAEYDRISVEKIDEDGKKHKEKETVENIDSTMAGSLYSRFFDQSCADWDKNPEFNMMFLKAQETIANNMLHERGHIFLNEVYDLLGFERTSAGAMVGWVDGLGDSYVDFGLYNQDNIATRRFVNGLENVILLDFNVDGVIYDKI